MSDSPQQKKQASRTVSIKKNLPSIADAIRPEETLAPLRSLFAGLDDSSVFHERLAQYIRDLTGARWATIHRQVSDDLSIALASCGKVDHENEILKIIVRSFREFTSQRHTMMIDNQQHVVLVVPFGLKDSAPLAFAIVLPPNRIVFADPCFTILHQATQLVVQRDLFTTAAKKEGAFQQATLLVEMFSRTNRGETFRRSLYSLASELERFFECDRVAIGVRSGRKCRVEAISGMTDEEHRNLGASQLSAALREAMAVEKMIVWPSQDGLPDDVAVSASHDDLLRSFQVSRIIVAPLFENEEPEENYDSDIKPSDTIGAIILLWREENLKQGAIDRRSFYLLKACRPHLSSLVQLLKKAKPGRLGHTLFKTFQGSMARRIAIPAIVIASILILLIPAPYRVKADATVQAVVRRTVAAPFESQLRQAYAKPGDVVEAGDLLAELDGREVRVKLAEAIAARSSAVKKRDNAMVSQNPSELQMAQFELERLSLEAERLQFENDNLMIRAPIPGVVVAGNLERSEGVPVSTGQKLFEIAPLTEMMVEIFIPETDVRHVEVGREIDVRLNSRGAKNWESTLARIHPVSEVEGGENIFVGEAVLTNENEILRPGMRGTVRIEAGNKSIGWQLFHTLWEYLRLKLW